MDIFDLCAKITIDTAGYAAGLDTAARQTETAGAAMESTAASHIETIMILLSGLGGTVSACSGTYAALSSARDTALTNIQNTAAAADTLLAGLSDTLTARLASLPAAAAACLDAVRTAVTGRMQTIRTDLAAFAAALAAPFSAQVPAFVTAGQNLAAGLWTGIDAMRPWLLGQISGFADSILTALKSAFGIASPSKVMRDRIGRNLMLGIGVGIQTNADDVRSTLQSALDYSDLTADLPAVDLGQINAAYNPGTRAESDVLAALNRYLPQIAGGMNQSIVLDTGALVGQTVSAYNSALGTVGRQRARAVI